MDAVQRKAISIFIINYFFYQVKKPFFINVFCAPLLKNIFGQPLQLARKGNLRLYGTNRFKKMRVIKISAKIIVKRIIFFRRHNSKSFTDGTWLYINAN